MELNQDIDTLIGVLITRVSFGMDSGQSSFTCKCTPREASCAMRTLLSTVPPCWVNQFTSSVWAFSLGSTSLFCPC